ncbi:serine/threonine protein kinase [Singulisphaera sp. PoT]|uniref:serine/threonine protein kinase n=1 Tax=Singulisphaera sp. PoT TaxID=3411797 RepID=UPI003BF4FF34
MGRSPHDQEPIAGNGPDASFPKTSGRRGEPTLPISVKFDDYLGETVAYRPEDLNLDSSEGLEPRGEPDSGFPEIDDLIDRQLGQYRLEAVLGQGSMGRVYRAEHLELARPCAIKVISPGLVAKQPLLRDRFWAEARAVATLLHPHVVMVHNLGSDRGYHFIEMEYIAGGVSLSESLIREGPFEPVRASTLVRQVVQALGAAHCSGMVHRDVKPSNVLLTPTGHAKLADFGLVRSFRELEVAGVPVAGTPTFMAPELFLGVPASHRSDIYAVGVMYYYLLTGRLPYVSDQIGHLIQLHRTEPVPDVRDISPDVPDDVAAILQRCLAKRPEDRPESADHLSESISTALLNLRETESLVRESVEGLDCFIQGGRDNYRILFPLPNDRLQEVYIEVSCGEDGGRHLSVFSICGPADPKYFEFALRMNDKLTYGSLSIRSVHDQPMFVMTRTFAREHVCSADIRSALLEIARRGDHIEHLLTNADLY